MKLLFLGTGTSTGVPQIGCHCAACTSLDPNDKRLRAAAVLSSKGKNILIDCGPDIRTQLIAAGSPRIDALLVTHAHYDHIGGLIDMRSYCVDHDFPIYCTEKVKNRIMEYFPYCFGENLYPGVPTFEFHIIQPFGPFYIGGVKVLPLPVMHYKMEILGFRFGDLAYITDCKMMPGKTLEALKGVHTLVLNALRLKPHMSHLSLSEAIEIADAINPAITYFTHMSHDMGPESSVSLPPAMRFAHDMLSIEV